MLVLTRKVDESITVMPNMANEMLSALDKIESSEDYKSVPESVRDEILYLKKLASGMQEKYIEINICRIEDNYKVRVGIEADKSYKITRTELIQKSKQNPKEFFARFN